MPADDPKERSLASRAAAHRRWGLETNRTAATQAGRDAFNQRFLDEADGDPVRAANLRKSHFASLALKSAQARRKARELTDAAEAAEAELRVAGGGLNGAA
jgi:hypothetical protein